MVIDYDRLLDDWADHMHEKAEIARIQSEEKKLGSYTDGYWRGYQTGIYESSAYLTFLEKRKRKMYETKEPEESVAKILDDILLKITENTDKNAQTECVDAPWVKELNKIFDEYL